MGVVQEIVLAEKERAQRVPKRLPVGDGLPPVVRSGLSFAELRMAERDDFGILDRAHGVDLAPPIGLGRELGRPSAPGDGESALLGYHVRRIGARVQGEPRGGPVGRCGEAPVAPKFLTVSVQRGGDRAYEDVHSAGPSRIRGIFGGGCVCPLLRQGEAVVGVHAVGDPGLIDDVGLDRLHPVRLIGSAAEVHQVPELISGDI